jgi:hypothetical protein
MSLLHIRGPHSEAEIQRVMRELGFDRETAVKHLNSLRAVRARLAEQRKSPL